MRLVEVRGTSRSSTRAEDSQSWVPLGPIAPSF